MKTKFILLFAISVSLCLSLVGCATSYHRMGFTGGFEETRDAEDTFTVRFKGNGYTTLERATDLTMLRAAELTIKNGFQYYELIKRDVYSEHSTFTTPGLESTTTIPVGNGFVSYSTYTPPTTYNHYKPRVSATVRMIRKSDFVPSENATKLIYDAAILEQSLKRKYKIR